MLAKLLPIGAAERKRDSAQPQQWSASAIARSLNNGAAREGSPGREPGVFSCVETKRRRCDTVAESFAPMVLDLRTTRGPGLTPGARLWRRFAALCVSAIWEENVNLQT